MPSINYIESRPTHDLRLIYFPVFKKIRKFFKGVEKDTIIVDENYTILDFYEYSFKMSIEFNDNLIIKTD